MGAEKIKKRQTKTKGKEILKIVQNVLVLFKKIQIIHHRRSARRKFPSTNQHFSNGGRPYLVLAGVWHILQCQGYYLPYMNICQYQNHLIGV